MNNIRLLEDIKGINFKDHGCLLYDSIDEYRNVAITYIVQGLKNMEKVICLIDEYLKEDLTKDLQSTGINIDKYLKNGQLILNNIRDIYRSSEELLARDTIKYWLLQIKENKTGKFNGFRVLGEFNFLNDGDNNQIYKLIEYEISIELKILPKYDKHTYLCAVNKSKFPQWILESIVKAHPIIINGEKVIKSNPYFINPKEHLLENKRNMEIRKILNSPKKNRDNDMIYRLEAKSYESIIKYVFNSTGDGLWYWDIKNSKVYISKNYFDLFGYDRDDSYDYYFSLGRPIHPKDLDFYNEDMEDVLKGRKKLYNKGVRLKKKDGDWQWLQLKGVIIERDDYGQALRMAGVFLNITDMKLAIEKLKKAKKKAEDSNISKSRFLANMSHEIRTPMNGIIGSVELMFMTGLSGEQREYVDIIRTSSNSLLRIINDILDYSKIEANKLELESIDFNFNKVIYEVKDLLNITAYNKGIKIVANIDNRIPNIINGDPVRLRQILSNIVGNAVKFSNKGTIEINVKLLEMNNNIITIQFYIEDEGIGIPEDKKELLFNDFVQLKTLSKNKYSGSGLGLAISKKLVEMMNGDIWFESEVGIGSKFCFTVNFKNRNRNSVKSKCNSSNYIERRLRVLIVEDNEINRMLIKKILEKRNIKVVTASNGKEAISLYKSMKFDLILMDIMMDEMDGFEASRYIREIDLDLNQYTPIIAITAYAIKGDKEKCFEHGMNDYIPKPININELYEKIDKWIE